MQFNQVVAFALRDGGGNVEDGLRHRFTACGTRSPRMATAQNILKRLQLWTIRFFDSLWIGPDTTGDRRSGQKPVRVADSCFKGMKQRIGCSFGESCYGEYAAWSKPRG